MSRSMQLAKERAKCPTCGQRPRLEPRTKRGLASAIRSENAALRALAGQLAEAASLTVLMFRRAQASGNWLGDDEHEAWTALAAALAAAQRAGIA